VIFGCDRLGQYKREKYSKYDFSAFKNPWIPTSRALNLLFVRSLLAEIHMSNYTILHFLQLVKRPTKIQTSLFILTIFTPRAAPTESLSKANSKALFWEILVPHSAFTPPFHTAPLLTESSTTTSKALSRLWTLISVSLSSTHLT
jgi:hypothetical protein